MGRYSKKDIAVIIEEHHGKLHYGLMKNGFYYVYDGRYILYNYQGDAVQRFNRKVAKNLN